MILIQKKLIAPYEYVNNKIKQNEFLQKYNVFIDNFDKFIKVMDEKTQLL